MKIYEYNKKTCDTIKRFVKYLAYQRNYKGES